MSSSRRRRDRYRFVEPEPPVEITNPDLANLITHLNSCGHPEWGYQVKDALREARGSENLDDVQARLVVSLAGRVTELGYELPAQLSGLTGTHEPDEGSEGAPDGSEVKENPTEPEGERTEHNEVPALPEIPEDASRDDLVAFAAEHLGLTLPGNIRKADALVEINNEIERRTLALEGEGE